MIEKQILTETEIKEILGEETNMLFRRNAIVKMLQLAAQKAVEKLQTCFWCKEHADGDFTCKVCQTILTNTNRIKEAEQRGAERFVKTYFGERCPDFCDNCGNCEAWKHYDGLFNKKQKVK